MELQFITTNPEILGGKPIIKGTRISVQLILEWIASGSSFTEINKNYPQLSIAAIKESAQFASTLFKNEIYFETNAKKAS